MNDVLKNHKKFKDLLLRNPNFYVIFIVTLNVAAPRSHLTLFNKWVNLKKKKETRKTNGKCSQLI